MHYWDMESGDLDSKLKFYACIGGGKRYEAGKDFYKVIQSFVLRGVKFYYSDLSQSRSPFDITTILFNYLVCLKYYFMWYDDFRVL